MVTTSLDVEAFNIRDAMSRIMEDQNAAAGAVIVGVAVRWRAKGAKATHFEILAQRAAFVALSPH